MIKCYSFFAKWRKKDIDFLNQLNLNKLISEGYDGFWVEEGSKYEKIINFYSNKDSFFSKTKPPEFDSKFSFVTFSEEDLSNAKYYMLGVAGDPKGYPMPKDTYKKQIFSFKCDNYRVDKKQISPFKIKKPKWGKNQVNFSLNWEWDYMFFKKEFYQEVLAPLGLKSKKVINYETSKPLEDTIQLDIPVAKSRINIEGSAYDIYNPRCEKKQYARQYLDYFPSFEEEFDFHICYTQEEFDGGFKRIIISKDFCDLLIKYKVIKNIVSHLIPMK